MKRLKKKIIWIMRQIWWISREWRPSRAHQGLMISLPILNSRNLIWIPVSISWTVWYLVMLLQCQILIRISPKLMKAPNRKQKKVYCLIIRIYTQTLQQVWLPL